MNHSTRAALIGFGGIGRTVLQAMERDGGFEVTQVIVREPKLNSVSRELPAGTLAISSLGELDPSVGLVVETAGQSAVLEYGAAVLSSGRDLAVVSAGAFADDLLLCDLRQAATRGGRNIHVVSGALGGLDALAAARHAGLQSVTYTGIKPPRAWLGTPAETSLGDTQSPQVIFQGNARQAANLFPRNANVAATVALGGIGFEETTVRLVSDPSSQQNMHIIEAEGTAGNFRFELRLNPLKENPKTSGITAYSVVHYLRTGFAALTL